MRGTSLSRSFRPPMIDIPRSSTSKPSGTVIFTSPQKARAEMVTSGPSISARRRSRSQAPMTATALVFPPMRQRPFVSCPLMTATCHRRPRRLLWPAARSTSADGSGVATTGRSRRHGLEVGPGPSLERGAHPLGELVERQPPFDHVLAEDWSRCGPGRRRPPVGRAGPVSRIRTVLGKGSTAVCHDEKSAPNRGAGGDHVRISPRLVPRACSRGRGRRRPACRRPCRRPR